MKKEDFIKAYNSFYDDDINRLTQIKINTIGGYELFYLIKHVIEQVNGVDTSHEKALHKHFVSNWGEMKLACKYSRKHDKFTGCLHKDTGPAMICFAPSHCPMIKKWSNCAYNRPDC